MTIVIKRYRNRKLYNTQTKRYITLEEIETLIKEQQDITVIENDFLVHDFPPYTKKSVIRKA